MTTKVRLSAIRAAVIDYFSGDMSRHLDMSTLAHNFDMDDGRVSFTVEGRSFAEMSGLTKLGSGAYSEVYAIDDKRAIKIVKKEDTGYAKFVRLCQENKNNPFLPKIHLAAVWGGKQVYIFERLTECPVDPDGEMLSHYETREIKNSFRQALGESGRKNSFLVLHPDLEAIANKINDMSNDLHNGNLMFRGEQIVITDPCSE